MNILFIIQVFYLNQKFFNNITNFLVYVKN